MDLLQEDKKPSREESKILMYCSFVLKTIMFFFQLSLLLVRLLSFNAEEEEKNGCFSPQIDADEHVNQDLDGCQRGREKPNLDGNSKVTGVKQENLLQNQHDGSPKQITVADVLCMACKRLLFCPIVLNCGHGIVLVLQLLIYCYIPVFYF